MKSVLISIQPKWCELIANGKKTIEVRKTKPKIATPFKCYIYCAKPKMITKYVFHPEDYPEYMRPDKPVFCKVRDASSPYCSEVNGNGKVIGEFVCYAVTNLFSDSRYWINETDMLRIRMTSEEIKEYAKGANGLYGWHISDLVIYDEPRGLSEFKRCHMCQYYANCAEHEYSCDGAWSITRPPRSWCYVEAI